MTGPEIVTERLTLDPLMLLDAEALFAYRAMPEVARFQGWAPAGPDDAVAFLRDLDGVEFDTPGTWFQLAVRDRETGRLIGDLGVHFLESPHEVEIGFTLDPAFQGRGLATEAVIALLDYLFGALDKQRVVASVDPRNAASIRLLQRVGMRQETVVRHAMRIRGEWVDDVVFVVDAAGWNARGEGGVA